MLRNLLHCHHKNGGKQDKDKNLPSYRVVVMGDAKVGKTEFIRRLFLDAQNTKKHQRKYMFQEPYKPTIEDFYQLGFDYRSISIPLDIVDTSGTVQFPAMRKLNIEKSDLVIIMYDARKRSTVIEAVRLYEFAREINTNFRQLIIFLAGKSDLITNEKNEKQNEASDVFYKSPKISRDVLVRYSTCSAKTGQNIRQVFEMGLEINFQKQVEKEN